MSDTLQVRVRIDDDDALAAALEVAQADPEVSAEVVEEPGEGDRALIGVTAAILIGAGVLAAARFIQGWWEKVRGGLVIDQRPDAKDTVYRDRDVPFGYVVVFAADGGKVSVEVKDEPKDATERLIAGVVSGVLGTAEAVKKAVEELLPGAKAESDGAESDEAESGEPRSPEAPAAPAAP